jgi:hypothetical protein
MALGLWVFDRLGTFAVQQLESQAGGSDALEATNLRLGVLTEDRMPAGASAR